MRDVTELLADIDSLCRQADGQPPASRQLARAMEDLLCEGYAYAHACDAEVERLRRRRQELGADPTDPGAARELRAAALTERTAAGRVDVIRGRLLDLRSRFDRIGGARAAER